MTINEKLDEILKNQKKILSKEDKITKLEEEEIILQNLEISKEDKNFKSEEEMLQELQELEKEIKKNQIKPLQKITKRDIFKGFVGAFIGIIGHFAFSKAADIGYDINIYRAIVLYIVAFFMIVIMLYFTGFKNVKFQKVKNVFLPLRATTLYIVSFFTVFFVYLIFGKIYFPMEIIQIFKLIAPAMMLAVLGAGMADLIGKIEE